MNLFYALVELTLRLGKHWAYQVQQDIGAEVSHHGSLQAVTPIQPPEGDPGKAIEHHSPDDDHGGQRHDGFGRRQMSQTEKDGRQDDCRPKGTIRWQTTGIDPKTAQNPG